MRQAELKATGLLFLIFRKISKAPAAPEFGRNLEHMRRVVQVFDLRVSQGGEIGALEFGIWAKAYTDAHSAAMRLAREGKPQAPGMAAFWVGEAIQCLASESPDRLERAACACANAAMAVQDHPDKLMMLATAYELDGHMRDGAWYGITLEGLGL